MKKRIFNIISTIVLCIFFIYGYLFLYQKYNIGIPCIIHEITGLYCPGCGITRCLFALVQGEFHKAFMYNQLIVLLLPILAIYYTLNTYYYITGKDNIMIKKIPNYVYIILLIIVISFGIIRNIPYFSFLRP